MDPGVPFYSVWLAEKLKENSTVGLAGETFSVDLVKRIKQDVSIKNSHLNIELDLIDLLWKDRPEIPQAPIFLHDTQYAGKSAIEKIASVREKMHEKGVSHYLLTSLDDVAWLLNIRGSDVVNNPVAIANVVVMQEFCYLFIDFKKVGDDVQEQLQSSGIQLQEYYGIYDFLSTLSPDAVITFDPSKTNILLENTIPTRVEKIEATNMTTYLKAIKNECEIQNIKNASIRDGVAMVHFIKWLKENLESVAMTEMTAQK